MEPQTEEPEGNIDRTTDRGTREDHGQNHRQRNQRGTWIEPQTEKPEVNMDRTTDRETRGEHG